MEKPAGGVQNTISGCVAGAGDLLICVKEGLEVITKGLVCRIEKGEGFSREKSVWGRGKIWASPRRKVAEWW